MHPWHDLRPGPQSPDIINVVVEIPKGSRNKYELDKESGTYHLSRVLYSPMIYPGDYGFIPRSYYEDGDPLDAIVLINEPTFPGCIIEARPIAIFKMLDKGAPDDKVLCVPAHNPFFNHILDMKDVPPHFLREVAHFFAVYKDLEGQRTLALGWEDAVEAKKQVVHGVDLYRHSRDRLPGFDSSDTAQREVLLKRKNRGGGSARIVPVADTAAKKSAKSAARQASPKKTAAKKPSGTKPAAKKSAGKGARRRK